jgi:hypothetical protein
VTPISLGQDVNYFSSTRSSVCKCRGEPDRTVHSRTCGRHWCRTVREMLFASQQTYCRSVPSCCGLSLCAACKSDLSVITSSRQHTPLFVSAPSQYVPAAVRAYAAQKAMPSLPNDVAWLVCALDALQPVLAFCAVRYASNVTVNRGETVPGLLHDTLTESRQWWTPSQGFTSYTHTHTSLPAYIQKLRWSSGAPGDSVRATVCSMPSASSGSMSGCSLIAP